MLTHETFFLTTLTLTTVSGATAVAIIAFGDTRKNAGHRIVAQKFAQITLLGAAAIIALLKISA